MSWGRKKDVFLLHTCQDLANTEDKVILKTVICTKEGEGFIFKKNSK